MIPVLLNHDTQAIIGKSEFKDGSLVIEFFAGQCRSHDELINIFGGLCYDVLEWSDAGIIGNAQKIRINWFSYQPKLNESP